MTVKKAIKILDLWINQREEKIKELDTISFSDLEIHKVLFDNEQMIIDNLKLVRKEIVPKCKHPKNMQDKCGSVLYCMSCNLDL